VLTDAGVEVSVVLTERAGHAYEMMRDRADLLDFDGVVVCSGDGLLFEAVQGLMARADWATVARRVAIGVLPGGSGNGLAVSLARGSGEPHGPHSNAFLIAKGHTSPLDLCAVDHAGRGRLYSFLSLEFGFIADVDLESEWMRSLGEARFTIQVLRRLLSPRKIRARLSWIPCEPDAGAGAGAGADALKHTPKHLGLPRVPSYWASVPPELAEGGAPPRTQFLVPLSQPVPGTWRTVDDAFYFMWNTNTAFMSRGSHVSPDSHWGDGYVQLNFFRRSGRGGSAIRRSLLQYMLGLETGAQVRGAVEMTPARAYRVEPVLSPGQRTRTKMAVDGEFVEMAAIQVEVLPGLLTLLGAAPAFQGA